VATPFFEDGRSLTSDFALVFDALAFVGVLGGVFLVEATGTEGAMATTGVILRLVSTASDAPIADLEESAFSRCDWARFLEATATNVGAAGMIGAAGATKRYAIGWRCRGSPGDSDGRPGWAPPTREGVGCA
jgi:hypothetical protein